jgi:hypothetical protein
LECRDAGNIKYIYIYTGLTQKNGAVLIVFTIETAPFFCVCPVYILHVNTLNIKFSVKFISI